jgi:hypothetical protein
MVSINSAHDGVLDQHSNVFMHPQFSPRHDADEPRPFLQDAFPPINHLGESGNGWVKPRADYQHFTGVTMQRVRPFIMSSTCLFLCQF